jgi:hypothetical protein
MANKNNNTYVVYAISRSLLSLEINADSLETALTKAKSLKEKDFVTFIGDTIDGDFEIQGIICNKSYDTASE